MNKDKLTNAYKGKNVYITGITGFKGGWLALMLHHLGANVFGIGLEPEEEDGIFYKAKIDEIAKVTIGDIVAPADESRLITSMIQASPDYIFHMAAQPIVSEGYIDPFNTFNVNIMGTVMLHEVIRGLRLPASKEDLSTGNSIKIDDENLSCKRISVVNITTDKVYEETNRPLKEDDRLHGFDPYSLSKSCSDMISSAYRDALQSPHYISTMRAGNVIGGGDMSVNRIVPDIIRSVQTRETLEIRSPHSVRPYQHVFDANIAYLWIALLQKQNKDIQSEYNIGPDSSQTMETHELVEEMKNYLDFDWKSTGQSIGKESDYLALDNSKLKSTGWTPAFSTNEKVVSSVANWYNNCIKGNDMQKYTLEQIKEAFNSYE